MSDTPSASLRLIHTRKILCQGFLRDDGRWQIEVGLEDTKTYPAPLHNARIASPGEPIHGIKLVVVVDDEMLIHEVNAKFLHAPDQDCHAATLAYQKLVGMTIGKGFYSQARSRIQNAEGCAHISELLPTLATAAIQTVPHARHHVAPRTPEDTKIMDAIILRLQGNCSGIRKPASSGQQQDDEEGSPSPCP